MVFELGDDMTLKTIKIIFAIWLLIVSVGHAEKSPSWHYQKDQSWERTKSDFPESATPGPFLDRMVEIDAWAKQQDRDLYDNSNKPYLMAMMVQLEIDEAKAKETAIPAPIAYRREANAEPTTSWLQDLRGFALACLVAYIVYNIIRPKIGIESRNARGRKWAAWSGVLNSILLLNVFFSKPDAALLFPWIIAITVITPIAYAMGWIYESIRGKSRSDDDQSVSKPNPKESVESLDDFPSHNDLCTLDAQIYSHLSHDELSEKITRALEDSMRSTAPESKPREERTTVKKESRCDNEATCDPAAKWKTCDFDGSVPPPLTLWPGDLVIHLHPDILAEKAKISDFWEMADYSELILTSRAEDFPDGISIQIPSDGDPAGDPPNVWRVLTGDRVLLIGERPQGPIKFLVNFRECALVYWRYAEDELPTPMEALQDTEPSGSIAMKEKMRIAVAKIAAIGTPHEFSEDWSIRDPEQEGARVLKLDSEQTDLLKKHLTDSVSAALNRRNLSSEQIINMGAFLSLVERLPNHYKRDSALLKFTSKYDEDTSWLAVNISEEGLALDQGEVVRYDFGSDTHSKTVFKATTTRRPDYEMYFDLEEWLRNFTNHAEDSHVVFSIDSVLGEKANS